MPRRDDIRFNREARTAALSPIADPRGQTQNWNYGASTWRHGTSFKGPCQEPSWLSSQRSSRLCELDKMSDSPWSCFTTSRLVPKGMWRKGATGASRPAGGCRDTISKKFLSPLFQCDHFEHSLIKILRVLAIKEIQ